MLYPTGLQSGRLVKRYKRFLADIEQDNGEVLTIHCPNTGSMRACLAPGELVWYSTSDNTKRKYPHTWEITTTPSGHLAGINTNLSNHLVETALDDGAIEPLSDYSKCRREVRYGKEKSRIDFLLSGHPDDERPCYVEVKNVTLMETEGQGLFPDSVSERGTKHLRELMAIKQEGARAVLLYCVQHQGIDWVEPATRIDPVYSDTLAEAVKEGVEVLAYRADIEPNNIDNPIQLTTRLPVKIGANSVF